MNQILSQGQLEVEPQKMSPNLQGATLITESVIIKLNQEIEVIQFSSSTNDESLSMLTSAEINIIFVSFWLGL